MTTTAIAPPTLDSAVTSFRIEMQRYDSRESFRALESQWLTLTDAPNSYSPFPCFEYGEVACATALANGAVIEMACVFEAHELVALWPVSIAMEGILRVARPLGCGCGEEYGGPIVKDSRRAELYKAAVESLKQIHADILYVPMLEHGSTLADALDAAPQAWAPRWLPARSRTMPGYAIGLRTYALWNDFLATRPSAFRSALRYNPRKLAREGTVSCAWCRSAEETQNALHWLFANKRAWAAKRTIDTPYLMQNEVRDFFIALAAQVDLTLAPLVACVKVNGKIVAASINLVGARQVEYFITTYDEAFGTYSVGNVLIEFVARWAHEHGRDFDFRPLHGDYKARWADRQSLHETRVVVLTLCGRCVEAKLLWSQSKRVIRKLASLASFVTQRLK